MNKILDSVCIVFTIKFNVSLKIFIQLENLEVIL